MTSTSITFVREYCAEAMLFLPSARLPREIAPEFFSVIPIVMPAAF
jgi:hypothetical protein